MLSFVLSIAFAVALVRADVVPTAPGPNDVFNASSPCLIKWNVDTDGDWKNMTISTATRLCQPPFLTFLQNLWLVPTTTCSLFRRLLSGWMALIQPSRLFHGHVHPLHLIPTYISMR